MHNLPLAFYLGRPVAAVNTETEVRRAAAAPPHGVVIARDATLARLRDPEPLVVLRRLRFGGQDVSIVSARM